MNVLIIVTHLLGVGHLARAAALGRAFARSGHIVTLVSGGRPAATVSTSGMRFVQLPSLHVIGTDFRALYDESGALADEAHFAARRERIRHCINAVRPDAVIVELFPFGRRQLADEHLDFLDYLKERYPAASVCCSIRDVLAPPTKPAKAAFANEILARHFDAVLVHGDPAVLRLEASWPVTPGLARQLHYTGFVRDQDVRRVDKPAGENSIGNNTNIVVSGGGSAASLPLLKAAADAAVWMPERRWHLLVGHGVGTADFEGLQRTAPANALVDRARPDFPDLLASAACSVSQAGYNTMLDLADAGIPAVVVPFEAGNEVEQAIRAAKFAEIGLVEFVRESALSAETLHGAVKLAMARGASRLDPALNLSGAQTSIRLVESAVEDKRHLRHAFADLDAALDRLAATGKVLPMWWRDDDAVDTTPALEALLALRAALGIPLALAVVPEGATEALAERLRGEDRISILTHGIAHRNKARENQKKQELVDSSPATLAALGAGRERLTRLFGSKALPVLVPPWNRMVPDLANMLPEAGFRGLSTFGPVESPASAGAVVQVNCYFDPIDWKGGGACVRAQAHIAALAALIRQKAENGDRPWEPIGYLSHHLVHDPWVWALAGMVLKKLAAHRSVRFVSIDELFGLNNSLG